MRLALIFGEGELALRHRHACARILHALCTQAKRVHKGENAPSECIEPSQRHKMAPGENGTEMGEKEGAKGVSESAGVGEAKMVYWRITLSLSSTETWQLQHKWIGCAFQRA